MAFPPEDARLPMSSRLPRRPSRRQTPGSPDRPGNGRFATPFAVWKGMDRAGARSRGGTSKRDDRGSAFPGLGNGYDPTGGAEPIPGWVFGWPARFGRTEEDRTMGTRDDRYDAAHATKDAGRLEEAVRELEAVVIDHPDFALAHSALAAWCTRLERHDDAVKHARRVCELEPQDPFSYTALSVACMRGGRIAEAEDALARSRSLQGR